VGQAARLEDVIPSCEQIEARISLKFLAQLGAESILTYG
jgi:hypothetical protein